MTDILETIKSELPKGAISSMNFEGANIVVYSKDKKFLATGDEDIKAVVNKIKKRVELRAEPDILMSKEKTEEER
jgi:predicted metal-dependent RNase